GTRAHEIAPCLLDRVKNHCQRQPPPARACRVTGCCEGGGLLRGDGEFVGLRPWENENQPRASVAGGRGSRDVRPWGYFLPNASSKKLFMRAQERLSAFSL